MDARKAGFDVYVIETRPARSTTEGSLAAA